MRATPTANLLAQPLNELTPERIFDAIAALTGLAKDLEDEQKARTKEHASKLKADEESAHYEEWDRRMSAVEDGIAARERARTMLADARALWRGRCAYHLADGFEEDEKIGAELKLNQQSRDDLDARHSKTKADLARLEDDKAFEQYLRERTTTYNQLAAQDKTLSDEHTGNVREIVSLQRRKRDLDETATHADGLTVEQAVQARIAAEAEHDGAQQDKGVANDKLREAQAMLAAAERGEDIAATQIHVLAAHDIDAVPLVDVVTLTEAQRPLWEARLVPYQQAVVVGHDALAAAADLLGHEPGSLLVGADEPNPAKPAERDLPTVTDSRFTLTHFFGTLARRATEERTEIDQDAHVWATSGFAEPITGRAGRIRQARQAVSHASEQIQPAQAKVDRASQKVKRAKEREGGAQAAADAVEVAEDIARLRERNGELEDQRQQLAEPLAQATDLYVQALADERQRQTQITAAKQLRTQLDRELDTNRGAWNALTTKRQQLDLDSRQKSWGASIEAARQHLLLLPESQQTWDLADWDDTAHQHAVLVRRACFAEATPDEQLPYELREIEQQQRTDRRAVDRVRLLPALLRVLGTHLDHHAQVDRQQKAEIERERADKTTTRQAAEAALQTSRHAAAAVRSTLAGEIRAKLKLVSTEFDRIDKDYGGYGGELDFTEPEPPAEPDRPWRWSVTPKWRRGEGKPTASYRLRGNTAQMDDKAVKLVCAAALAGTDDRPMLLVLDELGRNLGSAHRRDAVALFEYIGRDRSICVVGALQDDMERYALAASSLSIKLRRPSDTLPYNLAPVVVGSDHNTARVQLLAYWLTSYRPEPQT